MQTIHNTELSLQVFSDAASALLELAEPQEVLADSIQLLTDVIDREVEVGGTIQPAKTLALFIEYTIIPAALASQSKHVCLTRGLRDFSDRVGYVPFSNLMSALVDLFADAQVANSPTILNPYFLEALFRIRMHLFWSEKLSSN